MKIVHEVYVGQRVKITLLEECIAKKHTTCRGIVTRVNNESRTFTMATDTGDMEEFLLTSEHTPDTYIRIEADEPA